MIELESGRIPGNPEYFGHAPNIVAEPSQVPGALHVVRGENIIIARHAPACGRLPDVVAVFRSLYGITQVRLRWG